MFGAPGGAVVQVELDLALAGQLGEVALRGRAADADLNGLTTKAAYTSELATDMGQFLPDGMMPSSGPATALAIDKLAGNITHPANIPPTYTNSYAIAANKLEGYTK
jgi:hypothetical protein